MPGGAVEPGRYAQRPDGTWQKFTDKAELGFVPLACVTVKAPKPIERDEPIVAPVGVTAEPAPGLARAVVGPISGEMKSSPFKLGITNAPGSARRRPIETRRPVPVTPERAKEIAAQARRPATPADVFRAVADEFGLLPAMGQSRSRARFKTLVKRDEDAEAAAAYERAIEERQGRH